MRPCAKIINVSGTLSGGMKGHWIDRGGVQPPLLDHLYKTSMSLILYPPPEIYKLH